MIQTLNTAAPRCKCIVDLLSKVQRPFLFVATVYGQPPHSCIKKYHIRAPDEASAAGKAMEQFCKDVTAPNALDALIASNVPKARLE